MSAGHLTFFIGQCPMSDGYFNPWELLAIFHTLKSFKSDLQGKHMKNFSGNTML